MTTLSPAWALLLAIRAKSYTVVFLPILIEAVSPRTMTLCQIEEPAPSWTSPITVAFGAIQSPWNILIKKIMLEAYIEEFWVSASWGGHTTERRNNAVSVGRGTLVGHTWLEELDTPLSEDGAKGDGQILHFVKHSTFQHFWFIINYITSIILQNFSLIYRIFDHWNWKFLF